jgi:site-specific recombinase XerD
MSTKGRTFPPEPLTPGEVAAILGKCSLRAPTGIRNRALLTLLYRSGLRISEALALRPADISLEQHTARVLHGKGDRATVRGFHASADDALARWLEHRKGLGLRNGPLFCTLDGGQLSDRYVRDLLKRLAAKAGIEKRVHPHGLRHTFADELRRSGLDVVTISKLLGHSSIAVTSRYLDHLTNGQAVSALQGASLPPLEG